MRIFQIFEFWRHNINKYTDTLYKCSNFFFNFFFFYFCYFQTLCGIILFNSLMGTNSKHCKLPFEKKVGELLLLLGNSFGIIIMDFIICQVEPLHFCRWTLKMAIFWMHYNRQFLNTAAAIFNKKCNKNSRRLLCQY